MMHDSVHLVNCSFHFTSVQDGFTALCVAAQEGHLRVVEFLITAKADVNIQTNVSHIECVCRLTYLFGLCSYTIVIVVSSPGH